MHNDQMKNLIIYLTMYGFRCWTNRQWI